MDERGPSAFAAWMHDEAVPFLEKGLHAAGADDGTRVEDGELFVHYAPRTPTAA